MSSSFNLSSFLTQTKAPSVHPGFTGRTSAPVPPVYNGPAKSLPFVSSSTLPPSSSSSFSVPSQIFNVQTSQTVLTSAMIIQELTDFVRKNHTSFSEHFLQQCRLWFSSASRQNQQVLINETVLPLIRKIIWYVDDEDCHCQMAKSTFDWLGSSGSAFSGNLQRVLDNALVTWSQSPNEQIRLRCCYWMMCDPEHSKRFHTATKQHLKDRSEPIRKRVLEKMWSTNYANNNNDDVDMHDLIFVLFGDPSVLIRQQAFQMCLNRFQGFFQSTGSSIWSTSKKLIANAIWRVACLDRDPHKRWKAICALTSEAYELHASSTEIQPESIIALAMYDSSKNARLRFLWMEMIRTKWLQDQCSGNWSEFLVKTFPNSTRSPSDTIHSYYHSFEIPPGEHDEASFESDNGHETGKKMNSTQEEQFRNGMESSLSGNQKSRQKYGQFSERYWGCGRQATEETEQLENEEENSDLDEDIMEREWTKKVWPERYKLKMETLAEFMHLMIVHILCTQNESPQKLQQNDEIGDDSNSGDDSNDGDTKTTPWKSLWSWIMQTSSVKESENSPNLATGNARSFFRPMVIQSLLRIRAGKKSKLMETGYPEASFPLSIQIPIDEEGLVSEWRSLHQQLLQINHNQNNDEYFPNNLSGGTVGSGNVSLSEMNTLSSSSKNRDHQKKFMVPYLLEQWSVITVMLLSDETETTSSSSNWEKWGQIWWMMMEAIIIGKGTEADVDKNKGRKSNIKKTKMMTTELSRQDRNSRQIMLTCLFMTIVCHNANEKERIRCWMEMVQEKISEIREPLDFVKAQKKEEKDKVNDGEETEERDDENDDERDDSLIKAILQQCLWTAIAALETCIWWSTMSLGSPSAFSGVPVYHNFLLFLRDAVILPCLTVVPGPIRAQGSKALSLLGQLSSEAVAKQKVLPLLLHLTNVDEATVSHTAFQGATDILMKIARTKKTPNDHKNGEEVEGTKKKEQHLWKTWIREGNRLSMSDGGLVEWWMSEEKIMEAFLKILPLSGSWRQVITDAIFHKLFKKHHDQDEDKEKVDSDGNCHRIGSGNKVPVKRQWEPQKKNKGVTRKRNPGFQGISDASESNTKWSAKHLSPVLLSLLRESGKGENIFQSEEPSAFGSTFRNYMVLSSLETDMTKGGDLRPILRCVFALFRVVERHDESGSIVPTSGGDGWFLSWMDQLLESCSTKLRCIISVLLLLRASEEAKRSTSHSHSSAIANQNTITLPWFLRCSRLTFLLQSKLITDISKIHTSYTQHNQQRGHGKEGGGEEETRSDREIVHLLRLLRKISSGLYQQMADAREKVSTAWVPIIDQTLGNIETWGERMQVAVKKRWGEGEHNENIRRLLNNPVNSEEWKSWKAIVDILEKESKRNDDESIEYWMLEVK